MVIKFNNHYPELHLSPHVSGSEFRMGAVLRLAVGDQWTVLDTKQVETLRDKLDELLIMSAGRTP